MAGTPAQNGNSAAGNSDFSRRTMELAAQWRTPSDLSKRGGSQRPEKRAAGGHSVNLEDQAEHWATPRATDGEKGGPNQSFGAGGTPLPAMATTFHYLHPDHQTTLGQQFSKERRSLNPLFVEWLMGWPIGWTACEPVETASCLWLRRMRGALSTLASPPKRDELLL